MIKLIKWQLREYRSPVYPFLLGILVCAAVAAWLSHALLHGPLDLVVDAFCLVQWMLFLFAIVVRYSDMEISSSTCDVCTLALHIPLPRWWELMAKVLGMLPRGSGFPVPLQALIAAAAGLLLTLVNGYLLEHYIPQLEPLG